MGYTIGTIYGTGAAGWSTFTSPSNIYYVSDSVGTDPGTVNNISLPWKTTYAAYLAAVAGGGTNPWILCKQGDTFTDQGFGDDRESTFHINGVTNNPAVVGSYHPSFSGVVNPQTGVARPIIKTPLASKCLNTGNPGGNFGGDWLAVVGLDFFAWTADTSSADYSMGLSAVSILSGGSGYVFNDLIAITGSNGTTYQAATYRVTSVGGGGAITGISLSVSRFGRFAPTSLPTAFTASGGSGSGATFNTPSWIDPNSNTIGVAWGAPTSWSLIEDCMFRFFSNGVTTNTSGFSLTNTNVLIRRSQFYRNIADGIEGSGAPLTFEECVVYDSSHGDRTNSLFHNIYTDGNRRFGDNLLTDVPVIARGNISALGTTGGTLFRTGCLLDNNSFIAVGDVVTFGNVGTSNPANLNSICLYNSSVTNNVWTEGLHVVSGGVSGLSGMGGPYKGEERNRGSVSCTGNIFTNSLTTNDGYGIRLNRLNNWTCSNNIIYKWGASGREIEQASSTGPTNNSILDITISNAGTFYSTTGKTTNITGASRENLSPTGLNTQYVTFTVGSTANINAVDLGLSSIWISGLTGGSGGFDAAINDKLWLCSVTDGTHIVLLNSASVPGSYGSNGTIYIPYYNNALNATSGSGTEAIADIIVGPGLNVVALSFGGSAGPMFESPGDLGTGFAVGDTLNSTTFNAAAHGGTDGGFQITVAHICSNTVDGTNVLKGGSAATPLGTWPHPDRTSGTYYNSLFGGSGATYIDFMGSPGVGGAINNNKANWNDALTANALNIYIRAGFSIGSDTTPPILMAQICM